jgi:hypothetical protein
VWKRKRRAAIAEEFDRSPSGRRTRGGSLGEGGGSTAANQPRLEILPPNHPDGHHNGRGERIVRKRVEIGKGRYQDFLTDCTLVECEIRILCGAFSVNLFRSTFEGCTFRRRREFKNLRLTGRTFRGCTFLGKYTGCRFGNREPEDAGEVRGCDFSGARLLHLCDFADGVDVGSLRWPPWPHLVVTDLARSAPAWLRLKLSEELRIVQQVSAEDDPPDRAVTFSLPAGTGRADAPRRVCASQPYILIAEPVAAADGGA